MPIKFDKILGELRERDDAGYEFIQSIPSNVWNITHNLNKKPSIMIVDSGDNVVEGEEVYINNNQIQINFGFPFSGKAYLT